MNKHNLTYRKIADLVPYIQNSRTHSESQINQIAASIKEFSFTNPLLIEPDGGINRWQNFTSKDAILESTNQTFNSLKAGDDA